VRIVHEIGSPMQIGASGKLTRTLEGHSTISIFASSDLAVNHPTLPPEIFGDDEIIQIDGDIEYVRMFLKEALECLEALASANDEDTEDATPAGGNA